MKKNLIAKVVAVIIILALISIGFTVASFRTAGAIRYTLVALSIGTVGLMIWYYFKAIDKCLEKRED